MTSQVFGTLRQDLLSTLSKTKNENVTVTRLSFTPTLPEYEGFYAVVLDSVLSPEECTALLRAAEASSAMESGSPQWEPALIDVGHGRQQLITDVRNCGRIIWDDVEVVEAILNKVRPFVPELEVLDSKEWGRAIGGSRRKELWRMTRLNERMRFLQYKPGQFFQVHGDGRYETRSKRERSYFTLHLYLNDNDSSNPGGNLEGGATTFHSLNMRDKMDVEPKIGRVLIFQQANLLHSGEEVRNGLKLTMRTDLLFERMQDNSEEMQCD